MSSRVPSPSGHTIYGQGVRLISLEGSSRLLMSNTAFGCYARLDLSRGEGALNYLAPRVWSSVRA